jgi:hypothetical protein
MTAEQPPPEAETGPDGSGQRSGQEAPTADGNPSQATQLVRLAELHYTLGYGASGVAFAVAKNGPHLARMLRGGQDSLRAELAARYAWEHARAPSSSALTDALLVLEGRAQRQPRTELALRVARHGTQLVLDLGDPTGRAVVIGPDGWSVVARSPVLFRRTVLTGALPEPTPGGSLAPLRDLLNVSDESWPVLVGWLVSLLLPTMPHPILALLGEQGTGKSTVARILAGLIDPSPAQLRKPPRDADQWVTAAAGSWVVPIDNVSTISEWFSDAMCRAVTGEGDVRRKLYCDDDLAVFAFRRALVLTSIDPGALRGDLGERLVTIELDRIGPQRRLLDEDLAMVWQAAHPGVLGGLLDLAAEVLAVLPSVALDRYPRMADFAKLLAALDQVWASNALKTYLQMSEGAALDVVDDDAVSSAVCDLVIGCPDEAGVGTWTGTAAALHTLLTSRLPTPERPPRDWPKGPRGTAAALKRAAPALRAVGVTVDYDKSKRPRQWTLQHLPEMTREPMTGMTE